MAAFIFLSVSDFKSQTNSTVVDFLFNPATSKLFATTGSQSYKVQQDIDKDLPVRFMYSQTEGFDKGCFVNVKPLETRFSL